MAAGNLCSLTIRYTVAGQTAENVLGFAFLTSSATMTGLVTDFLTHVGGSSRTGIVAWMYPMSAAVTAVDVTVRDVFPGTAAAVATTTSQAGGQTATTDLMPPQCAMVITWRTALNGRAHRGRSYLAGMQEGNQVAGAWTSTFLAQAAACPDWIRQRYVAGGSDLSPDYGLVVISRQLNGATRPQPHGEAVTSYTLRSTVFNQRRRTLGTGI